MMKYRLHRTFFPWIFFHTIEFWYYYLGAILSLWGLHHFSSELPLLAKNLGDMSMNGKLDEIDISHFFVLAGYILLFRTLSRLLFFYPARLQQKFLRVEMVHRFENAPPRNYKEIAEGEVFQSLYNDINRLRAFIGFALLQFGNIIIAGFIFIPKIRSFNSDFLVAFTPLLFGVVGFSGLIYLFQPYVKRNMEEYADLQNFLLECYSAKKTVQNYHAEGDFLKLFNTFSGKELRTFFIQTMGRVVSFPLVKLGVGASLIWAALIVKNNDLPASDLIFFSSFLFLILEPVMFLSWIGIVASQGFASWGRLKSLVSKLDMPLEDEWLNESNNLVRPDLPLWDQMIVPEIVNSEWNVLIGETGCGKSFLLEKYSELLNKQGQSYSFIHQEPYLYNDTLGGNIFLGAERTPELVEAAKGYLVDFGLDVLTTSLDNLLDLELGENGKKVSGGQAKRIALVRSLVADVDYVIWDDPFSSVDLILESQIIKKLQSDWRLKNKTFIITSHRLSSVKSCENLVLINKELGIQEMGKVNKLLNEGSKTNAFFQKQLV